MRITIEHEGYRMVVEPEQIAEYWMSTPAGNLSFEGNLNSDSKWEKVPDGD